MPKIWCFFCFGQVSVEAFSVYMNPEVKLVSSTSPVFPRFLYSVFVVQVALMVHICWPPLYCLFVVTLWKHLSSFWLQSLWLTATYKTKADRKKEKRKKKMWLFICCECLHFVFPSPSHTVTSFALHSSHAFLSITCMLLCIYAIVAIVTMMVCGFRPDFHYRQCNAKNRQNKENN